MATDIRLGDNDIELEGNSVKVVGHDLHLKDESRVAAQRSKRFPLRRALVHGFKDELVINFNEDYDHTHIVGSTKLDHLSVKAGDNGVSVGSGGVQIHGPLGMHLQIVADGKASMLLVGGSAYFDGDLVQVEHGKADNEWGVPKGGFEVVKELKKLIDEVAALKRRVIEIEKKK